LQVQTFRSEETKRKRSELKKQEKVRYSHPTNFCLRKVRHRFRFYLT
jgi:hypothetical protein